MIAANLPDIDVLGFLVGENLAWRRGWTHGPVALLLLPIVLALTMLAFERWRGKRGTRPASRLPVRFGWLLALAYIGTISHPLLDFLNNYGVRFLMPFSDRWFYGDAVFIVDVWMWSVLALGTWLARRRRAKAKVRPNMPAVAALVVVALYAGAMWAASEAAERMVATEVARRGLGQPRIVVASPVPIDPFRRDIVYEVAGAYGFGEVRWLPAANVVLSPRLMPTNMTDSAIARAAASNQDVSDFLYWSRLPFADVKRTEGETSVTLGDARYGREPGGRFSVSAAVPQP